jgi:hypothetical protein
MASLVATGHRGASTVSELPMRANLRGSLRPATFARGRVRCAPRSAFSTTPPHVTDVDSEDTGGTIDASKTASGS